MKRRFWARGQEDILPLALLAISLVLGALLSGARSGALVTTVVLALGVGYLMKHLVRPPWADMAIFPPVAAVLAVAIGGSWTVAGSLFLAAAGVGLLLWVGADLSTGLSPRQQIQPAVIPALGTAVAIAVMLFLPGGTGGQVGLAALVLVGALALVAWIYAQSVAELGEAEPTG